jgi:hypothetical protein
MANVKSGMGNSTKIKNNKAVQATVQHRTHSFWWVSWKTKPQIFETDFKAQTWQITTAMPR